MSKRGSPPGSTPKKEPRTEHEWIIHSINIHGAFFERWCQQVINDNPDWQVVLSNYPVEFPSSNSNREPKESALDIRADLRRDDHLLSLIIECKKNNPEFINWIFFEKHFRSEKDTIKSWKILKRTGSSAEISRANVPINIPQTNEGRETKGQYNENPNDRNKTKTANDSITKAANQVTLATQAIVTEEIYRAHRRHTVMDKIVPVTPYRQIILPIIVTTARLHLCEFDPKDVEARTGEIPWDKATLKEHPYLSFEYPVPRHLQDIATDLTVYADIEQRVIPWMDIIIVQSESLSEFLTLISNNMSKIN
jgi:hypothetical protein